MEPLNHYKTLGILGNASQEEIDRAYRRLALRFHPDRHPPEQRAWAEEQMKQINKAYEVLDDPETRMRYDATIYLRFPARPRNQRPASSSSERWFTIDPFHSAFSRNKRKRRKPSGLAWLVFDTLTLGFLVVGAYLLHVEWDQLFHPSIQGQGFPVRWILAGIWYILLIITFLRMIPPRR